MARFQQIRRYGAAVTASSESIRERTFVELDGQFSFLTLAFQIRENGLQNLNPFLPSNLGHEQMPVMFRVSSIAGCVVSHGQTEEVAHGLNRARVAHFNTKRKDIGMGALSTTRRSSLNRDAAFSVNKSSKISQMMAIVDHPCSRNQFIAHGCNGRTNWNQKQGSLQQKSANSVNLRLGLTSLKENAEPTLQVKEVCREHIRTPKGMTCSDLRSNAKRTAEMTVPAERRVTTVQDAKTAQILWYGCLGTNNRRKLGVVSNIDTTVTS